MHVSTIQADPFHDFIAELAEGGLDGLRAGLIGKGHTIDGPFGPKPLLYADYVASGRALRQLETFMMENVLPFYANTHTEASFTGARTTGFREAARKHIARLCGADDDYSVVFTGSGATSGLNRLVTLCGVPKALAKGRPVRIVHGPYEHHSNILPWRESGAEVVEVPEAATGGPDPDALRAALSSAPDGALLIGSFSAASNVTGALSDVVQVTRILQEFGARSIWDYAGAGPYVSVSMRPAKGVTIDAITVSPHKFIGGPGASGIMILRKDVCACDRPSWPGGGTVVYVSSRTEQYSKRIEDREEAGTPNILGDIRAGLAFLVKDVIGQDFLDAKNTALTRKGLEVLAECDGISVLGNPEIPRLPIFSIVATGSDGAPVHFNYAARLLSDLHGLQTRGGCACAGPYAHRLLGFGPEDEARIFGNIALGQEMNRPGFVRFNLSALMTDAEVEFILDAIKTLPDSAASHREAYCCDPTTAQFAPITPRISAKKPRSDDRPVALAIRKMQSTLARFL